MNQSASLRVLSLKDVSRGLSIPTTYPRCIAFSTKDYVLKYYINIATLFCVDFSLSRADQNFETLVSKIKIIQILRV